MTFKNNLQKFEERYKKEHSVICPNCNYELEGEDLQDYITYWGEEVSQKVNCPDCNESFLLKEIVDRTWKVIKDEDGEE